MSEGYRVELEVYSGPLDLLLQLVNRAEVSIYDIPIARITDEYLERLRALPEPDLETAADFLVLAATLLAIKARMLLPQVSLPQTGAEGDGEEEDPRAELVRRLLAYRQYRQAAVWLGERLSRCNATFDRAAPQAAEEKTPVEPGCLSTDLTVLGGAYRALLAALAVPPARHEVAPLAHSVEEKMSLIVGVLEERGCLWLHELLAKRPDRGEVVAVFLALLELVRLGLARARQEKPFGRLEVIRGAATEKEGEGRT